MVEVVISEVRNLYYECPNCGNEDIELGQNFCQICGEAIEWKEN